MVLEFKRGPTSVEYEPLQLIEQVHNFVGEDLNLGKTIWKSSITSIYNSIKKDTKTNFSASLEFSQLE